MSRFAIRNTEPVSRVLYTPLPPSPLTYQHPLNASPLLTCDSATDEGLRDADQLIRLLSHQTAEGNSAGESREVDEDGGRDHLRVEAVLEELLFFIYFSKT